TVEWTFVAGTHSSTSGTPGAPDGIWDSGLHSAGFVFSQTFTAPGSFPYFCSPHGVCCGMIGSVTVMAPTPTPTPTPPLPLIQKGTIQLGVQTVATGLTAPIELSGAADGSGRIFIVQQTGQVRILKAGAILPTSF